MSARNLAPVRTLVRELIPIAGSFAPNGSSALASTAAKGLGFTVARTNAGIFTVTFSDKYADLVSVQVSLQTHALTDLCVQVGDYDSSAKTLIISTWVAATSGTPVATDVSANANNRIHFVAWFRNSAASPVRGA